MKREELGTIQKKVEELRAVFLFGKRALPFMEDIFAFVQEIIPVVDELKVSVDATSEKLPRASRQLDKVTHATEIASTEILNTLETMFSKIEAMMGLYDHFRSRTTELQGTAQGVESVLEQLIRDSLDEKSSGIVRTAWTRHMDALRSHSTHDGFRESLQGLQSDCTNIMMALQVQDITAQQIAAVNKLMQSVDEGLNRLMKHFSEVPHQANPQNYNHSHLNIQFDVSAEYFGVEDRQKAADALIEGAHLGEDVNEIQQTRPGEEQGSGENA
jgi:chemotaxis regulatin CheY-phosphate phosphatase CheZ